MRLGVLFLVGLSLSVITGACGGPGTSDDACTSQGNICVDLAARPTPYCYEALPQFPCQASGSGFTCCAPKPGSSGADSGK